jgi:hypothetical protein
MLKLTVSHRVVCPQIAQIFGIAEDVEERNLGWLAGRSKLDQTWNTLVTWSARIDALNPHLDNTVMICWRYWLGESFRDLRE